MQEINHKITGNKKLALKITLHCVAGCGAGDTLGLMIGTVLNWPVLPTMALGIILGFLGGYGLTIMPLLKKGINFKNATRIAVVSDTISITVMETAENITALLIPGLLYASFSAPIFWIGFAISAVAGFVAAYPVNYYLLVKRGHIHQH
ncbi:MAG: DUF4396 domain-containing protein [Candidatus Moranbacteria bacterium]|nr:DUF4396 domain-containing protein [Candidatus Moranbacteria bacterium]